MVSLDWWSVGGQSGLVVSWWSVWTGGQLVVSLVWWSVGGQSGLVVSWWSVVAPPSPPTRGLPTAAHPWPPSIFIQPHPSDKLSRFPTRLKAFRLQAGSVLITSDTFNPPTLRTCRIDYFK